MKDLNVSLEILNPGEKTFQDTGVGKDFLKRRPEAARGGGGGSTQHELTNETVLKEKASIPDTTDIK